MTFGSTLDIAISGLTASQSRARTVAANIANANTDGYSRRVTELAERNVSGVDAGVRLLGTQRAEAGFLTADRMRLETDSSFASERAATAAQLTTLVGEPGVENGLFREYARFETALRDAAATPESSILQADVLDRANLLVRKFAEISTSANGIRSSADQSIATAVDGVNFSLQRLQELNALPEIQITPVVQDERQRLVDGINEVIPVTAQTNSDGSLRVITDGGVFLLGAEAREIEFNPSFNVNRGDTLGDPLSGVSVNGIDITPSGTGAQRTTTGKLAALFEARDQSVPGFLDQIDGLAADLINRFADDSADPTKVAGAAGLFTDGTDIPPGLTDIEGVASRLSLNAAIDPAQGGELYRLRDGIGATAEGPAGNGDQLNRLITAFTGARTAPTVLGTGGSQGAAGLASQVSANVSFEDRNASEASIFAGTRFDVARQSELEVIGVDTDQELQELLLVEQAYAANSRVIQTVQQMMQTLMEII